MSEYEIMRNETDLNVLLVSLACLFLVRRLDHTIELIIENKFNFFSLCALLWITD